MILGLMQQELRRDEGVRYIQYLDGKGIPSCGVGHNLRVHPLPTGWTFPLNDTEVNILLAGDIADTLYQLDHYAAWWRQLDEVRQRVVVNMTFNLGIGDFLQFQMAIAAMKVGNYLTASAQMKASAWYGQVGARAVRLCTAMQTGVMPI